MSLCLDKFRQQFLMKKKITKKKFSKKKTPIFFTNYFSPLPSDPITARAQEALPERYTEGLQLDPNSGGGRGQLNRHSAGHCLDQWHHSYYRHGTGRAFHDCWTQGRH